MSASDDEWDAPQAVPPAVLSWFSPERAAHLVDALNNNINSDEDEAGGFFTEEDCDTSDSHVNFLLNAVPSASNSSASEPFCARASREADKAEVVGELNKRTAGKIDSVAVPALSLLCEERACTPCEAGSLSGRTPTVSNVGEYSAEPLVERDPTEASPTADRAGHANTISPSAPLYYREYVYPKASSRVSDGDDDSLSSGDDRRSRSATSEQSDEQRLFDQDGMPNEAEDISAEMPPASGSVDELKQSVVEGVAESSTVSNAVEGNSSPKIESGAAIVERLEAAAAVCVADTGFIGPEGNLATQRADSPNVCGKESVALCNPAETCVVTEPKVISAVKENALSPCAFETSPTRSARPRTANAWLPKNSPLFSSANQQPKNVQNAASVFPDEDDFLEKRFSAVMLASVDSTAGSVYDDGSFCGSSAGEDERPCNVIETHTWIEPLAKSSAIFSTSNVANEKLPSWFPEKTAAANLHVASDASVTWGFGDDDAQLSATKPTSTTGGLTKKSRISKPNGIFGRPMTTPGAHYREAEHTANDIRSILDSLGADEKARVQNTTGLASGIDALVADIRSKPIAEFSQLAAADDAAMQSLIETVDDFFALGDYTKKARPQEFQRLALPTLLHPTRPNVLLVQRNAAGKTFAFVLSMCLRVAQYKLAQQRPLRSLAYNRKPILQHTNTSSVSAVSSNGLCELCIKARAGGLADWTRILAEQRTCRQNENDTDGETDHDDASNDNTNVADMNADGKSDLYMKSTTKLNRFSKKNMCPPIEPRVVVICPTRELVEQIYMDARRLCRHWSPSVNIVQTFGGQSYHVLRRAVANCHGYVDILICTLGRLQDDPNLSTICFSRCIMLVCDDIDHLTGSMRSTREYAEFLLRIELDRARRDEAENPQKNISVDNKLQIVLATATNTPECISKARVQMNSIGVIVGSPEMPQPLVPHRVVVADDPKHKKVVLGTLITQIFTHNADAKVLIFVNLRKMLGDVRHMLISYSPLFRVLMPEAHAAGKDRDEMYDCIETLQGDMRAFDRAGVFKSFANGVSAAAVGGNGTHAAPPKKLKILISTDVMCRGVDIPDISHVINFNLPQLVEVFTNRLGRCGRLGNVAAAYSIFQLSNRQDERALLSLMPVMRDLLPSDEQMPKDLETVYARALSHYRGGGTTKMQLLEGDVELTSSAIDQNRWRVEREHEMFEQICDDPQYMAKQVILNMGFWL